MLAKFTEIYLTRVKISQKVLGGLLFLTHTVYYDSNGASRRLKSRKLQVKSSHEVVT